MLIEPKISGASVVLVGHLNPAIFSPDWFVRQGLVSEQAVLRDEPDYLTHPQLAQFKLDWCQVVVEPNKFSISSVKDPLVRMADLAVRTFAEFLPHTPIRQLGINRQMHFKVESLDVRDSIGYRLAPPTSWGDWSQDLVAKAGQKRGGMMSLTMQQQVFDYERTGHLSATIQPSSLIEGGLGVFLQVNDHYEATKTEAADGAHEMIATLEDRFEASLVKADKIIDQVMRLAHVSS